MTSLPVVPCEDQCQSHTPNNLRSCLFLCGPDNQNTSQGMTGGRDKNPEKSGNGFLLKIKVILKCKKVNFDGICHCLVSVTIITPVDPST